MNSDLPIREISRRALSLRKNVIRMLAAAGSGHPAGALGLADIYAALFFGDENLTRDKKSGGILHYDFAKPGRAARDLLVISGGHTVPIYYAVLREINVISDDEMLTLRKFGSRLQGHPERVKLPWLETTSGPLGEGLSQAAGMAYAIAKFGKNPRNAAENLSRKVEEAGDATDGLSRKVVCVLGDGELDEGENWEAALFAAKNRLNNLVAVVDFNNIQIDGKVADVMPLEPLAGKFAAFGWRVLQIDGNNVREILAAFAKSFQRSGDGEIAADNRETARPTVIIAKTVPGKGVSFMENDYRWHGAAPTKEEAEKALRELDDFAKENKGGK